MKSLAVRVLGDFAVDGVEPQALGSKKARLALHPLALAGASRPGQPSSAAACLACASHQASSSS
jgi:hypothetical protein